VCVIELLQEVDLIKLGSKFVRTCVRPHVHPQSNLSISVTSGVWVEVDEWCTTLCPMTQSKDIGSWPFSNFQHLSHFNLYWLHF